MVAAVVAYILTGIACVVWDFKKPFLDRPAYARRPDKHLSMVFMMIAAGFRPGFTRRTEGVSGVKRSKPSSRSRS